MFGCGYHVELLFVAGQYETIIIYFFLHLLYFLRLAQMFYEKLFVFGGELPLEIFVVCHLCEFLGGDILSEEFALVDEVLSEQHLCLFIDILCHRLLHYP